jgi:hypothetical protein
MQANCGKNPVVGRWPAGCYFRARARANERQLSMLSDEQFEELGVVNQIRQQVRAWREACLAHPAVGQVVPEEIVRLYYDYALGVGNGALPPGRSVSSFAPHPPWSSRPWPPADKYGHRASDAELGLIAQA